jgi:cholesterol transport system auxiliary component
MISRRSARFAGAVFGLTALGGCITLFPKATPAQLYRFEAHISPAAQTTSGAPASVTVRVGAIDFDPASRGERILTVRGSQVAYIGDARWAIPADDLFEQAIERGFDASGVPVRLVAAARPSAAQERLRVRVARFEVDYGARGAPTIVVRLRAALTREADLSEIADKDFEAEVPASANRMGAIVKAFDAAVTQVVNGLVGWVGTTRASGD